MTTPTTSSPTPAAPKKAIEVEIAGDPGNGKAAAAATTKPSEKKVETKPAEAPKVIDDGHKVNDVFELRLSDINVKPGDNPRQRFDAKKLQELANSIKVLGVSSPLAVYRGTDGKYYLIAGERRLRAAKIANLGRVQVKLISVDPVKDATRIGFVRITENLQRENLTYYEEAQAFKRQLGMPMLKNGKPGVVTQADIATEIGKTEGMVSQRLKCLELPEEIQKAMEAGKVPFSIARELTDIRSPELQLEKFHEFMENAAGGKKAIAKEAEKGRSKKRAAKADKDGKRRGRPPLTEDGELPDITRQALDEAQERLRKHKLELRKKDEMRESIATVYERYTNARSDEKKNFLKGYAAGLEYAVSIRKEL